jgi:catechol 2,3-dioxygenase-like lactoylglutathione lyase family enzyme
LLVCEARKMKLGIDGIDHAVVAVRDLEAARERFQSLGFSVTPRRRFADWGTANYSVMFENDFIELLGVIDPAAFLTPGLQEYLERQEGCMAVTMRANDVTKAHALLTAANCEPTALGELTILCEAPGGVLPQSFRWTRVGEVATPDMYLMVVEPLTPQNMRRPEWLKHANGATRIRSLTVVVKDPQAVIHYYERLFAVRSVKVAPQAYSVFTGHGDFRFCNLQQFRELWGHHADPIEQAAPFIASLCIETHDIARARAAVADRAVEISPSSFFIPPEEACGVLLEFVARL